jgi:glycosyltransferase involved in cell wall biosynthesis
MISGFMLTYNEEELVQYALESWLHIAPVLSKLAIVDNGSTDATLEIVHRFMGQLPIELIRYDTDRHHGHMRSLALSHLPEGWVLYLDSDETWTGDMLSWLQSGKMEEADQWEFFKYSTIQDREHYTEGGNGPSRRLFRYRAGVGFPQEIHTEPLGPGLNRLYGTGDGGPFLFDHTACKSQEALWAKGFRYQWAQGVPGIGPIHEYIGRVQNAYAANNVVKLPQRVLDLVFTGPMP